MTTPGSEPASLETLSRARVPLGFCLGTLIVGVLLVYFGNPDHHFDYSLPASKDITPFLEWGLFWSGVGLLIIGSVGILLARYWWAAWRQVPKTWFHYRKAHNSWYWWIALIACTLLGLWLRLPMQESSLWWDETWGVQRVIVGDWETDPEDSDKLIRAEPSWADTLFHFSKPTNHVTYSVLARLSHEFWLWLHPETPNDFSEAAIRFPALFFGLLLIWTGADLCRRWGFPVAGLVFALIIAMHPWFIRYSADARAYTLIALFSLLLLQNGLALLTSTSRRYWLTFALILAFTLWSFPFIFLFAAPLSLGILLIGARYPETTGLPPLNFFLRWLSMHALALVLVLPLVAPLVPQIGYWDEESKNRAEQDYRQFLPRLYAEYTLGMPWSSETVEENIDRPSIQNQTLPGTRLFILGVLPLLLIAGLQALARHRKRFFFLFLIGLSAIAISVLLSWFFDTFLYTRFLIFGAVLFACAVAVGIDYSSQKLRGWFGQPLSLLFLISVVGLYCFYTQPQRLLFERYPIGPVRETANELAKLSEVFPDLLTTAYFPTRDSISLYYPPVVSVQSLSELKICQALAARQGRPLVFVFELRDFLLFPAPDLLEHIERSGEYQQMISHPGSDLNSSHLIYVYQPIRPEKEG